MDGLPAVCMDALLAGKARAYTRPGTMSGIDKRPLAGAVRIGELGIEGDEQDDLRVHGGPDKAVHHYAFDHYAAWRNDLGTLPLLEAPGAFGENISTRGITEAEVCLGDSFALGDALLEVSQGRQPCWKLNDRFGVADMARRVQATGRSVGTTASCGPAARAPAMRWRWGNTRIPAGRCNASARCCTGARSTGRCWSPRCSCRWRRPGAS